MTAGRAGLAAGLRVPSRRKPFRAWVEAMAPLQTPGDRPVHLGSDPNCTGQTPFAWPSGTRGERHLAL